MRVWIASTLPGLAGFAGVGAVPAGGERFVAAEESEDAEYDALCAAAEASAGLVGPQGRRVVLVAEVTDPDGPFDLSRLVAVYADTEPIDLPSSSSADDLPDLGWFAAQELGGLID